MGWTENMSSREFQAVAAVRRARIDIADSRKLRDEAQELLAALRRRRRRRALAAN